MDTKENQFPQFGLCLNNEGYAASLEIGKVYRVIPDKEAATHGYIRVIDESGEDYAYTMNEPFSPNSTTYCRCKGIVYWSWRSNRCIIFSPKSR